MAKTVNKVIDVSWRFGVTVANSESDNVGRPFLQLNLHLDLDGKATHIFGEMTISQFYKFLHDLEKTKSNLDLLT